MDCSRNSALGGESTMNKSVNINRNLVSALNPYHLELIIFPTEQCNFRCSYCYEDFEIGKMSDNVISAVKHLINYRVKNIRSLQLGWFGGEPLLAKDIMIDLSNHAKKRCEENNIAFLRGSVTTNGYMLNLKSLEELIAIKQSHFQISLDGFETIHDSTRKLASGRGTFEKIWNNLIALHRTDKDFQVLLRLHLTPENLESMKLLIETIKAELLPDQRFSFLLKPIGNWGGKNSANISTLNEIEQDVVIAEFEKQLYGDAIPVDNDKAFYICYAAKPNVLTIRANGTIGKCTVALSDPRNNIGHINDDGTLTINNEILQPWLRGFKTNDPALLGCPASGLPDKSLTQQEIKFIDQKN